MHPSAHYLIDVYAGRIIWQGRWLFLPPELVALAWQWQPNQHRCFIHVDALRNPAYVLHKFERYGAPSRSMEWGPKLTIDERRAARVVRFGRVARAQGLRLPECPALVFDDMDDLGTTT